MSEAYTNFAAVYDVFMDETPYQQWSEFLIKLLEKYQVKEEELVLDLGCGTGTLTELLATAGYDMIGIDNAEEMLAIAMEKKQQSQLEILYLLQDMRELELYGTVKAVISICDSLNYLLEEEDLLETFSLVNNYLDPSGIFIFDFNTIYKYETVIGDTTIAENRENCSFIWENYYHEQEEINEYDLTIFVKREQSQEESSKKEDGCYDKFTETHLQRGYTLQRMKDLIAKSGMEFIEAIDADTKGTVTICSERIYIVARECSK